MNLPLDILTPRLRLVAITPSLLRMGNTELSHALEAGVPDLWPPEHWESHVLDVLERQMSEAPNTIGWNRYIVLRSSRPVAVGVVGGFGQTESKAEVGYSVLSSWHGRGIATEALATHVDWMFAHNQHLQMLCAHTFPELAASVRVLEKCGFEQHGPGEEERTVQYRLMRRR